MKGPSVRSNKICKLHSYPSIFVELVRSKLIIRRRKENASSLGASDKDEGDDDMEKVNKVRGFLS